MRNTIASTLTQYAAESRDFMILTADLGYSVFDDFLETYPEKFCNMGIAENNMVGVATGLAMTGKKVFVYSIATFLAAKCFEQIRDDVCYHDASVVLIGTGAGFAYGQAGYTHYSNDDLAILRTIPNLVILSPSDPKELKLLLDEVMNYDGPVYIRAGKNGEQTFTKRDQLRIGEAYYLHEGKRLAVVAHGTIMQEAVELHSMLASEGVDVSLVSCPSIKPLDIKFFDTLRETHDHIIVLEEHYETGGLASALRDAGMPVTGYGVKDKIFYEGGSQSYLRTLHGLDAQSMYAELRNKFTL